MKCDIVYFLVRMKIPPIRSLTVTTYDFGVNWATVNKAFLKESGL